MSTIKNDSLKTLEQFQQYGYNCKQYKATFPLRAKTVFYSNPIIATTFWGNNTSSSLPCEKLLPEFFKQSTKKDL